MKTASLPAALVLAVLGAIAVVEHPAVLAAVNPLYGLKFLLGNSTLGFFSLGAVMGGNALRVIRAGLVPLAQLKPEQMQQQ